MMGLFAWCRGLFANKRIAFVATRDSEQIVATRTVRASRAYSCQSCAAVIAVGDSYNRITYRTSGGLETDKHCLTCHALMAVDRP